MWCPFCNHPELKVTDSRDVAEGNAIRRRRECCQCSKRFTTFETIDLTIQVKKRDGTYEDFQHEKLIEGMESACRHTRVSRDQVRSIADALQSELLKSGIREIESRTLGESVMRRLQELDMVAYIRFACVYKRFTDIQELVEAIRSIGVNEKE
ncbi:MAG: transcriptional regulator NrdR [Verrucomicrobiota bacterium]|nr:transcriptional regulator NrdR [Verrucomicrobiota bacterium]